MMPPEACRTRLERNVGVRTRYLGSLAASSTRVDAKPLQSSRGRIVWEGNQCTSFAALRESVRGTMLKCSAVQ